MPASVHEHARARRDIHENLLAPAAELFKFWQKPLEIAGWQGE
jgi:hypothetical protein